MAKYFQHLKYGAYVLLLLYILSVLLPVSLAVDADCNYYSLMAPNTTYYVYNSEYPNYYQPGKTCRWVAVAPEDYKINVKCQIDMPESADCEQDQLLISLTGNLELQNANKYCGSDNVTLQTAYNNITIGLISSSDSSGGRFLCTINAVQALQPTCDCGWKQTDRIVGGQETKVNEYPMMAGIVDFNIRELICGGTIVASRYVLSAAHCFRGMTPDITGVVVGEHDITTGAETNSTKLFRVEEIIVHAEFDFNSASSLYDIAVVKTERIIVFTMDVGPACLPFRYYEDSFTNQTVEILGWGTTEFTGPKSDVLLETNVTVLSPTECRQRENGSYSEMCTFTPGHDACQSDSGGPLLWHTDDEDRLYLIGIISSGYGCAENSAGINTRVTTYLQWIMANTIDAQYCVK